MLEFKFVENLFRDYRNQLLQTEILKPFSTCMSVDNNSSKISQPELSVIRSVTSYDKMTNRAFH